MSGGYTKLFSDIVDSSIWREPPDICKVWITLLALADRDGYVRGSVGWLADKAKVAPELCQQAIQKFNAPDPLSRTTENDGRRIETLEDGWLILNYIAFRDRLSDTAPSSSSRERVRKHRERYNVLHGLHSVTTITGESTVSEYASVSAFFSSEGFKGNPQFAVVWADWIRYRMALKVKKPPHWADFFRKQAQWLEENYTVDVGGEIINASIRNGWQGLFEPRRLTPVPKLGDGKQLTMYELKTKLESLQHERERILAKPQEVRTKLLSPIIEKIKQVESDIQKFGE
ncbi:MAG: hypothetical protein V1784_02870 [bacterium]